ncbi:MAG: hypothetical protein D6696_06160 [Acidobacteria bacterium]|nr:MAG: hypothetical protein D6696_06160 [Acidobacteriota bacterium]
MLAAPHVPETGYGSPARAGRRPNAAGAARRGPPPRARRRRLLTCRRPWPSCRPWPGPGRRRCRRPRACRSRPGRRRRRGRSRRCRRRRPRRRSGRRRRRLDCLLQPLVGQRLRYLGAGRDFMWRAAGSRIPCTSSRVVLMGALGE